MLEFDSAGKVPSATGAAGIRRRLVGREHGIFVDHKDIVWLTGNADNDADFEVHADGKFVLEIGKIGPSGGSNDTTLLGEAADMEVDPATNEVYVADGYDNRRVIVFDADTGAYKRHWGAYGKPADDAETPKYDPAAPVAQHSAIRCTASGIQGRLRLRVRSPQQSRAGVQEGRHLRHRVVRKSTLGNGSTWDLNFWPDANQSYLLNIDGENNVMRILNRADGKVVGSLGRSRPLRRPVPLGACRRRQFEGQRLYRRSRQREPGPEVQAGHRAVSKDPWAWL